ncbi:unnamed protein product [Cochlearia groenlandica]
MERNPSLGPICEICGNQGWKGLLVTCSKCRIACQHRYCMAEHSFEHSKDFVCVDCSMRRVRNSLASESIKAVPRSHGKKVRVESSNPVPKWKTIPETSKMKLISPDEVRKLSSGSTKPTFKVPRPVPARSSSGFTRQTVCFPRDRSMNSAVVARKTNPFIFPPKRVDPRSQHTLQIRPGVIRHASKAQETGEGTKSKIGSEGNNLGSKEICRSILSEKLLQLLPYRPALRPTWRGHIVDAATPSEFNCQFCAQPASEIRGKAYKLSKTIPVLLEVELVPIGNILNDLFVNRNPALSDVEIYIFPDDKNTKRFDEEHGHLFATMKSSNAMIRINIKDTPLLIFSSKLLDKSSQIIIKMQKRTNNFLWGIFLETKKSLAYLPGSSSQAAKHLDDGDVVNNETRPQSSHSNSGKQVQRH